MSNTLRKYVNIGRTGSGETQTLNHFVCDVKYIPVVGILCVRDKLVMSATHDETYGRYYYHSLIQLRS